MNTADRISDFCSGTAATAKSIVKLAVQSHRSTITRSAGESASIIILGNGPALAGAIADDRSILERYPLMAVNFAANTDEFLSLRPEYYILADPHFFSKGHDNNVDRLHTRLNEAVDWPMTLYVPAASLSVVRCLIVNPRITVETFNPVGVEGFAWLENAAFRSGRGMPRPRNVLIPAIMCAILAGFRRIALAGADHSWMRTIEVNEQNEVISVQPHFYKDNQEEQQRVVSTYRDYRLHDIVRSFYIAFKSYFAVRRYADRRGIDIINVTPGSFIDAFRRMPLRDF